MRQDFDTIKYFEKQIIPADHGTNAFQYNLTKNQSAASTGGTHA